MVVWFHTFPDLLIDILSKLMHYSRPQMWNIESIKGLDGLTEVYKVGIPIQVHKADLDIKLVCTHIFNSAMDQSIE